MRDEDVTRALRREEMIEILAEGRRAGALAPHAEELARNVLVLRHTKVADVMLPWERVESLDLRRTDEELRAIVLRSGFTRLPAMAVAADGSRKVVGYVHQLDVIDESQAASIASRVRPILELAPDLPLDRAVARRRTGQALVAAQRLGDLVADGVDRIEGGERLLEDHGDAVAAHALHLPLAEG